MEDATYTWAYLLDYLLFTMNRKIVKSGLLVGIAALCSASVNAMIWVDRDDNLGGVFDHKYVHLSQAPGGVTSYTGEFDLTQHGYDGSIHSIDAAIFKFVFADGPFWHWKDSFDVQSAYEETVSISFESVLWGTEEVDGVLPFYYDFVLGAVGATALGSLQDGVLQFTISLLPNASTTVKSANLFNCGGQKPEVYADTYLKAAKLIAFGRKGLQVPDSGLTIIFLGTALLALSLLRRRIW